MIVLTGFVEHKGTSHPSAWRITIPKTQWQQKKVLQNFVRILNGEKNDNNRQI